jgi:hypothetical protein
MATKFLSSPRRNPSSSTIHWNPRAVLVPRATRPHPPETTTRNR